MPGAHALQIHFRVDVRRLVTVASLASHRHCFISLLFHHLRVFICGIFSAGSFFPAHSRTFLPRHVTPAWALDSRTFCLTLPFCVIRWGHPLRTCTQSPPGNIMGGYRSESGWAVVFHCVEPQAYCLYQVGTSHFAVTAQHRRYKRQAAYLNHFHLAFYAHLSSSSPLSLHFLSHMHHFRYSTPNCY